ncbi:MAG: glycosyltransferase family 4 protein [candidate division WOR-3 bacterium]|nr:MAG: glycosyltransferase family 4 protein [candidate division WOR-3 bacterium]
MGSGSLEYQLEHDNDLWADPTEPGRLGRLLAATRQLVTLASRRTDFDIVHFHSLWWSELVSPLVLHRLGKKVVFTMSLMASDHPAANNPSAIVKSRGGTAALSLLRQFDGIIAVSPAIAEDCRNHGVENVRVLANFLAIPGLGAGRDPGLREEIRARHRIPTEDHVLLFIGAAIRRKGLDVLVESYIRVARDHPRTWLVLVGPCTKTEAGEGFDESYVDTQRDRLEGARLSDRVIWAGMVPDRREMAGYYNAADVFVLPTRAEGLGNVLIEAAAAGLPSVATNLPGITDVVVVDGETGFLVPPENAGAVAKAVERIVSEPSLLARMSSSARSRSRLFNFESYCRRLKDFYLQVSKAQLN